MLACGNGGIIQPTAPERGKPWPRAGLMSMLFWSEMRLPVSLPADCPLSTRSFVIAGGSGRVGFLGKWGALRDHAESISLAPESWPR